jgi:predicted dehydrogenase
MLFLPLPVCFRVLKNEMSSRSRGRQSRWRVDSRASAGLVLDPAGNLHDCFGYWLGDCASL